MRCAKCGSKEIVGMKSVNYYNNSPSAFLFLCSNCWDCFRTLYDEVHYIKRGLAIKPTKKKEKIKK